MDIVEKSLVFTCQGAELVGILHVPENCSSTGFIAVPAGSVQYRAGSGRQLVNLARVLANEGFPVLRFDYRGMGDSSGEYRGFRFIGSDLECAIGVLKRELPAVSRIILYGGCEAASGIMIHASSIDSVGGVVLANPWVGDERIKAAAMRTHYARRLFQREFWTKLLFGKYRFSDYFSAGIKALKQRITGYFSRSEKDVADPVASERPFQQNMLTGLAASKFPVLFIKSGGSLLRQEFETLIGQSGAWRKAIGRSNCNDIDLPEADQTFSTSKSKEILAGAIIGWARAL